MKYAHRRRTSLPGDSRKNFFGGSSRKSSLLDVQLARERHLPRAGGRVLGIVDDVDLFDLTFRVVRDDDLQRAEHRHDARRAAVQVLADAVLELRDVDDVLFLGDADPRAEIADRLGRVAAGAAGR